MTNCFTVVINYLSIRFVLPNGWNQYTLDISDMDLYVKNEKRFLAKKEHIGFFKSFCTHIKDKNDIVKDDIVLTRKSVGVCINQFTYWVYNEDLGRVVHKQLDKGCLIMRVNNG
jgi:hypothetical protein